MIPSTQTTPTTRETMTHRQRMEAVFAGETPDRMAWFGDLTYWHQAHATIGDLPEAWRGPDGLHQMHHDLDIGEYIPGCTAGEVIEGDRVEHRVTQRDDERIERWETPEGCVQQTQRYAADTYSWGYTEHAVKTAADLRVVQYIYENRRLVPHPEWYQRMDREFADHGFGPTHIATPATPISELNKHWVGVLDLTYLLIDEAEQAQATLDAIERFHDEVYRSVAAGPRCYAMICENLSAETMGGYFDRYIGPHLERWCGWLHAAGHETMIHNDGTLRGTLNKLPKTGVRCIDSVVPAPVGDVPVSELRSFAGDDEIVLLGGMPGAMFASPFTAADVEKHVLEVIEHHKDSGRFMFGVADQLPPDGDPALIRLVSDLIAEHGRY